MLLNFKDIGKKTDEELANIFAAVTDLYLLDTGLDEKTGAELAQVFTAIPTSVTTLSFERNYLELSDDKNSLLKYS